MKGGCDFVVLFVFYSFSCFMFLPDVFTNVFRKTNGLSRTQGVAKRDADFRAIFFVFFSHFISISISIIFIVAMTIYMERKHEVERRQQKKDNEERHSCDHHLKKKGHNTIVLQAGRGSSPS